MRSIESEGESIDDAIDQALQALQVGRDRVEIEILGDVTRGLFGFGGKKARVRATVRAPLSSSVAFDAKPAPDDVPRETSVRKEVQSKPRPTAETTAPPRPASDDVSRETLPRKQASGNTPTVGVTPSLSERPTRAREIESSGAPNALADRSRVILEEILSRLGVSCTLTARPGDEPDGVVLEVGGDSGGLVIGRRGQTLDAIEYIVNRIVSRREDGSQARVVIDVEGYRERRREYLVQLARRLADKAKQTGRVVTLNPMSPRDRRVVHLSLQADTDVVTRSQGDGYYRKLLILPAEKVRRAPRPNP